MSGMTHWEKYFRSIDCFCIPDEFTFCKRTGFDGEEVCKKVITSLREVLRRRLVEDKVARYADGISLSQLQWFPVLSTLCSIINGRETVEMSSIYIHASATGRGLGELKSMLLQLMQPGPSLRRRFFEGRLKAAVAIIARFSVRGKLGEEEVEQVINYLMGLFPCGVQAPPGVERADGVKQPVVCGQCKLFHTGLHRSNVTVKTVDPDWLQGLSEWLQGGIHYSWPGVFQCHPALEDAHDAAKLRALVQEQIGEYRLEKCLEGLTESVGAPWVLKAYESLCRSGVELRQDATRSCAICMANAAEPGIFGWMWTRPAGNSLAVCGHCHGIMVTHGLCSRNNWLVDGNAMAQSRQCEACVRTHHPDSEETTPTAEHRVYPCQCALCKNCIERLATQEWPCCPSCEDLVQWVADERALLMTGWRVVRPHNLRSGNGHHCDDGCGMCIMR